MALSINNDIAATQFSSSFLSSMLFKQNRGTGELSFLTFFMNFGGSMVRVFTSLGDKAPMSVVMGSLIGIVMNGTILSQILLCQAPAPKKAKKTN